MLEITDKAREMLDKFAEQADDEVALKIVILGRGPKGFQYDLQLIGFDDAVEDDVKTEVDGMTVFVGARSAPYLDGTVLDYKETLMGGGFSFENPNPLWIDSSCSASSSVVGSRPRSWVIWRDVRTTLFSVSIMCTGMRMVRA